MPSWPRDKPPQHRHRRRSHWRLRQLLRRWPKQELKRSLAPWQKSKRVCFFEMRTASGNWLSVPTDMSNGIDEAIPAAHASQSTRLLSNKDVQACFGKSDRTLRRWARQGLLLPLRIGGSIFYRQEDIASLIESQLLLRLSNTAQIAAER